jgi:feruloyl esterase
MIKRVMTGSVAAGVIALSATSLMATAQTPQAATPSDCANLTALAIPEGSVTSATMVTPEPPPAGGVSSGAAVANKAYCRVQITLKPEPGSNIRIEVWLPDKAKWNGKFLGTGNGGSAGSIVTSALIAGVNRGYAVANTDMGSSSGKGGLNFGFGIGRPDLQKDFNYRATDGMTLEGKAITAAYYGDKPKYSYFEGCSSGGAQALEQAQHLPLEYNGVIAGAPANQRPNLHVVRLWDEWNNLTTPDATVSKHKMELVAQLAVDQCDTLDNVKDGIINDPRVCKVDLRPLLCKKGEGPECLTARQAQTVRAIWQGATNPRTKAAIYWGFEPGSEAAIDLHWDSKVSPTGDVIVSDNMINWSDQYQQAHPDGVGFNFDTDVMLADLDIKDANWADAKLDAFAKNAGKVIIYHGWADGLVPPGGSVAYFEAIAKANEGYANTSGFARLFMVPGMGHCSGGVGPDQFDMLTAMEHWEELATPPDSIMATRLPRDDLPALSRPLCPYPAVGIYTGKGNPNDAANFICGKGGGSQAWSDH